MPAWLVLGVGILMTMLATHWVWRAVETNERERFGDACDRMSLKIQERLTAYKLILHGAAGLFAGNSEVDRKAWRSYVSMLTPEENISNVQGVGFALLIPADQLARHVAAVRAEGFPDYDVRPAGQRDVYTSIIYLEPFRDRNLRAFGYDMFSEPVRQAAMVRARDSGTAQLSGGVTLVQETAPDVQRGVLMYVPVYRKGMRTDTVERRRQALLGWVYSPYRMNDLMMGILQEWRGELGHSLDLHIYDGNQITADYLLYDSIRGAQPHDVASLVEQRSLDFNDHHWLLEFRGNRAPGTLRYAVVWLTLASGLAISGLMYWLVLSLANTRFDAQRIADTLTAEVTQRDRLLGENEQRWKVALEGSGLGVWDWNLKEGHIVYSRLWKEMLGYSEEDIGQGFDEWKSRVHPHDLVVTLEKLEAYLAGRADRYDCNHRLRCKDGSYKWIWVRGMVIQRDAAGNPMRMIGTHSDISEYKSTEDKIRRLTQMYAALSETNRVILLCESGQQLFDELCRIAVEFGGMKMAWVGLVEEKSGDIKPVSSYGEGQGYLVGIDISSRPGDPRALGPTGTATRENHPVWFNDFMHDPRLQPWRERAAPYGWGSSAALPICRHNRPVGALTFYSGEIGWYDDQIRRLLEEMGQQISFALDKLDSDAALKANQLVLLESEQRFRTLVEQSIAGAFIEQGGKYVYVNPRMEQILGYAVGDGLVGQPVETIVTPRDLPSVEAQLREMREGRADRLDLMFTALRKDGSEVDVGASVTRAVYRQAPAAIGLMQDISDRKVAEEQIRRYAERLKETLKRTVSMVTTLVEMRDPYTAGHETRVAALAVDIGREMGLDEVRLEGLQVGGQLHDVGKVIVPAEILAKPSRISDIEYGLIKQHPVSGYDILKEVEFPWPVARIAHEHHERIDGSGYPRGLKGDEILLEARIVAVADVVEAMASHRPYRPGVGIDKALAEIERGAGSAYDPAVVQACLRLFREKSYRLPD